MSQYTRDERKGQNRNKRVRMAADAMKKKEGVERLTSKQMQGIRDEKGLTHAGQGGNQYYNNEGSLTDIGEGSNPFKVDNLADFDAGAYGRGSQRGKGIINSQDVKRLASEGGYSPEEMAEAFKDMKMGRGATNWLARKGAQMPEQTETPPADAGGESGGEQDYGIPTPVDQTPGDYQPEPTRPIVPGMPGSGVSIGGDLNQNIGKTGDMNTTIGDGNTFGAGASIGNDNSVTIGSQNVGGGSANANAAGFLQSQAKAKSQAYLNFS